MRKTKHLAGWGKATFLLMTAVCLLLFITGLVMFVLPASELIDMPPAQAALRHSAGVMHGVATWVFCLMCGRGVWLHVRMMWHKHGAPIQWALGLANLSLFTTIAMTGLLLLYGSPDLHDDASPLHFWMGALCPLVFLAHSWRRFAPSKLDPHL